jgi:hypothetical protein
MIAILFSFEKKGFHIETLDDYIKSNLKATILKRDHQYRLVATANSYHKADEICDYLSAKEPFKSILNKK